MHKLLQHRDAVNRAYPRLGNMFAVALVATRARKTLLLVAPSGTGKSTVLEILSQSVPDCVFVDTLTMAGLKMKATEMSGFRGILLVDDLAATTSEYSRHKTVTTLAKLVERGQLDASTFRGNIVVTDFRGGAVINVQPIVFRDLVRDNDWEAITQDKTLRYYHLYRPLGPPGTLKALNVDTRWTLDDVARPRFSRLRADALTAGLLAELERRCAVQWSEARVRLHLPDLLRACAALDGRKTVTRSDVTALHMITASLGLERHLLDKTGFETRRRTKLGLLYMMVELASYEEVTIERIAADYKMSVSSVYRVVGEMPEYFVLTHSSPASVIIHDSLRRMLNEAGAPGGKGGNNAT